MLYSVYSFVTTISVIFFGIIWVGCLSAQLACNSLNWVNDKKSKPFWFIEKFAETLTMEKLVSFSHETYVVGFLISLIIIGVIALIWPLAYPGIIVFGILYAIRKFKRFQKKVTSAFNDKADKKHTHIQSDIKE